MSIWKSRVVRAAGLCILFLAIFLFLSPPVSAAEAPAEDNSDYQQQVDELLRESGADSLLSELPEDGRKLLSDNGIDSVDQAALMNLSFTDFLKSVWEGMKSSVSQPLAIFINAIGIILLCALLHSMEVSFEHRSFERVFSTVSVLCLSAVIIAPIASLIISSARLIRQMSDFMAGFVPVYVGIVTASGKPVSAMTYNACLLGVGQVVSRVASTVLVPLLAIYLALCLTGSASREINMEGISKTVKNVVITVLGLLMTVFVGLLSVQGVVAASADTVTLKTAKFAVSTFVPVVGGAIGEALNSVQGCVGVVRSTVGGFGIVAVAVAFLPTILSILLMQLSLAAAGGVSDTLGTDRLSALTRSASSVLSLLLGILLVFAILFIVSISVMLALSSGSA